MDSWNPWKYYDNATKMAVVAGVINIVAYVFIGYKIGQRHPKK